MLKWKAEGRKQDFMNGIKDKVVVITGASSESILPAAAGRLRGQWNGRNGCGHAR
jgi:3-oxoacyl-ACP reductase-like protein